MIVKHRAILLLASVAVAAKPQAHEMVSVPSIVALVGRTVEIGDDDDLGRAGVDRNCSWVKENDGWPAGSIGNQPTLTLSNVQRRDSGVYKCADEEGNIKFIRKLIVADLPDEPHNKRCVTGHQLSHMRCCWAVGKYPGIPTKYTMGYFMRTKTMGPWFEDEGKTPLENSGSCSNEDNSTYTYRQQIPDQCCDIPLTLTVSEIQKSTQIPEFEIRLKSENELGSRFVKNVTERPFAWVKPSPPYDLKLEVSKKKYSFNMITTWHKPNMAIDDFEYRIRFRVVSGNKEWEMHRRILTERYEFEVERSHSVVEVQVAAWPVGMFSGYWSNWSESALNSTGISFPSTAMRYESIVCDVSNGMMTIIPHWIPYGRLDEPGFRYEITYRLCSGEFIESKNISSHFTKTSITTNMETCIVVSGAHCNSGGCSRETTKTIQSDQVVDYTANVHLHVTNTAFLTSWEPMVKRVVSDPDDNCIIKVLRSQQGGGDNSMQVVVAEEQLPCNSTRHIFEVTSSPCFQYEAHLSSWNLVDGIAYMKTSRSSARKPPLPDIESLPDFELEAVPDEKAQFRLIWEELNGLSCKKLSPCVVFRPIGGSECSGMNNTCSKETISKPLNCTRRSSNVTAEIYGDTTYNVKLAMCCPTEATGTAKSRIHFFPNVTTSKNITSKVSAPSEPRNFQWGKIEKDVLSWEQPVHPNGQLTGYVIGVYASEDMDKGRNFITSDQFVTLTDLCSGRNEGDSIWVRVFAFNKDENSDVFDGNYVDIPPTVCYRKAVFHGSSVAIIISVVVCVILVILAAVLAYFYKQRLKFFILRALWPSVPRPNIIVAYQDGLSSNGELETRLLDVNMENGDRTDADYSDRIRDGERYDDIRNTFSHAGDETAETSVSFVINNKSLVQGNGPSDTRAENKDNLVHEKIQLALEDPDRVSLPSTGEPSKRLPFLDAPALHNGSCSLAASQISRYPMQQRDGNRCTIYSRLGNALGTTKEDNSLDYPERPSLYGSTPSLPSYLSCASYAFTDATKRYQYSGVNYAHLSGNSLSSYPEYMFSCENGGDITRYASSRSPAFQSTPVIKLPNQREFLHFARDTNCCEAYPDNFSFVSSHNEDKHLI